MSTSRTANFRKLFLILPIFTIGFWLFAQKECELTPNPSPTRALAEAGSQSPEPKIRSLHRASALLRQAADMVEKDNPLAVRLIRQAIAILKHEVMSGIDAQDYDRISMPSAPGLNETNERNPLRGCTTRRILPRKDSEILPRLMIRNVERPRARASLVDEGPAPTTLGGYIMNRNRHGVFQALPKLTCYGCEKPIDLEHEDTLVEMVEGRWSQAGDMIRWHQDCFNHYLDEAEET